MSSKHLIATSVFCHLFSGIAFADVSSIGLGYTVGAANESIYSIDLQNGATSQLVTIPASTPVDASLLNKNTLYVLGNGSRNIYTVNLQNNSYSPLNPIPIPDQPFAIAVANESTAYVVTINSNSIYSVNLQTGAVSFVTTISGSPRLSDIAIASNTTAYVTGLITNQIFQVDLQTGASSVAATLPGNPQPQGIALANNATAYVVGNGDSTIRVVNLETGTSSIISTISGSPGPDKIGINNTTAYVTALGTNDIYTVNLLNGDYSILASFSGAPSINGMAFLLQMPTSGLNGNNQTFANYLNTNAPIDVIRSFALLPGDLANALQAAAPTRNAFLTYASQNAYLAASQVLADHGRQKRFHFQWEESEEVEWEESEEVSAIDLPTEELLVDSSDRVFQKGVCPHQEPWTVWLTPFGEYAREKAQNQTPAFSLGLGGAVLGFELSRWGRDVIGFGAAYAYSHVHEEAGEGQANLNQGFLTVYSTLYAAQCYFDLGLWGGYYHSNNQRKISFPGVDETAESHTHGWQVAPHFEVGYDGFWIEECGPKWFGIEPFLMADWVANWESAFQESGAHSYNMGQKGRFCSLLRGETGLRFHEISEFNWGKLIFREKASYAYQKAFDTGHITAFLIGSPGTFTVDTLTGAQNLGVFEFSMLFISENSKAPYADIRYQGEFGSQYQSHQGTLEIGKAF